MNSLIASLVARLVAPVAPVSQPRQLGLAELAQVGGGLPREPVRMANAMQLPREPV